MSQPSAGSSRDTPELAKSYSETSRWQHQRGVLLLEIADPSASEQVLDIGCGTGELSVELARRVGPSGHVVAIDPDEVRLKLARTILPPGLDNLEFEQASGDEIRQVDDESIDLVYSNYALHWMLNPPAVFGEVQRVLRPGGRFVTEFLGDCIHLFEKLLLMMPSGKDIMKENIFLGESKWREIIATYRFEISNFEWPQFTLYYKNLPSLFDWLEATSQGAFDAKKITPEDFASLERKFPSAVTCPCRGLRMTLRRLA